jgi:hypothetical protein
MNKPGGGIYNDNNKPPTKCENVNGSWVVMNCDGTMRIPIMKYKIITETGQVKIDLEIKDKLDSPAEATVKRYDLIDIPVDNMSKITVATITGNCMNPYVTTARLRYYEKCKTYAISVGLPEMKAGEFTINMLFTFGTSDFPKESIVYTNGEAIQCDSIIHGISR